MSNWQPIETAPKDGTRVLVCSVRWGVIEIGEWCDFYGNNKPFWYAGYDCADNGPYELDGLTHWMPLPSPPTDKSE